MGAEPKKTTSATQFGNEVTWRNEATPPASSTTEPVPPTEAQETTENEMREAIRAFARAQTLTTEAHNLLQRAKRAWAEVGSGNRVTECDRALKAISHVPQGVIQQ